MEGEAEKSQDVKAGVWAPGVPGIQEKEAESSGMALRECGPTSWPRL